MSQVFVVSSCVRDTVPTAGSTQPLFRPGSVVVNVCCQLVVLMDPAVDENDDVLRQNRSREKQFMFDLALDGTATQVYDL